MRHINYKSDFDFLLHLTDAEGNRIPVPDCDWSGRFYTSSSLNAVEIWRRDGVTHCCTVEGDGIRVVMDNHGLSPGRLQAEFRVFLPDGLYPDGTRREVMPEALDIELVRGKGDLPTKADAELALPMLTPDYKAITRKLKELLADVGTISGGEIDALFDGSPADTHTKFLDYGGLGRFLERVRGVVRQLPADPAFQESMARAMADLPALGGEDVLTMPPEDLAKCSFLIHGDSHLGRLTAEGFAALVYYLINIIDIIEIDPLLNSLFAHGLAGRVEGVLGTRLQQGDAPSLGAALRQSALSGDIRTGLSDIVERIEAQQRSINALELRMWRLHDAPAFKERLVAIGYSTEEAADVVDSCIMMPEEKIALREGLATLNYSPVEIEDCMVDVPALTFDDIAYAKEILDAWDPQTTTIDRTWFGDTRLVVFPKIDTSKVTRISKAWGDCGNLRFMPLIDTSAVTTFSYTFFGDNSNYPQIRRVYDFDYSSAKSVTFGMSGGLPRACIFPPKLSFPVASSLVQLFILNEDAVSYPQIEFPDGLQTFKGIWQAAIHAPVPPPTELKNVSDISSLFRGNDVDMSAYTIHGSSDRVIMKEVFCTSTVKSFPRFDFVNVKSLHGLCMWAKSLPATFPDISKWDKVEDFSYMFADMGLNVYPNRIEGLNLASATAVSSVFGSKYHGVYYMRLLNLGQGPCADYDFAGAREWGRNTTDHPDARQSLVDSLITDSFDRAAAGMPAATVRLSRTAIWQLTAEEKARITAKGFTLV